MPWRWPDVIYNDGNYMEWKWSLCKYERIYSFVSFLKWTELFSATNTCDIVQYSSQNRILHRLINWMLFNQNLLKSILFRGVWSMNLLKIVEQFNSTRSWINQGLVSIEVARMKLQSKRLHLDFLISSLSRKCVNFALNGALFSTTLVA